MSVIKRKIKEILPENAVRKLYRVKVSFKSGVKHLFNADLGQTVYAIYHKRYKVNSNTILYESSYGVGMICNPYAIFKAFTRDKDFRDYKHIWVLDKLQNHKDVIEEYKQYKNVKFVERGSKKYLKYLVSAKFLINNTSFSGYFSKKPEQIYVNTWHSITVKKLGFDMPDGNISSGNMLRNLIASDYIVSANDFTTERFKKSYRLDGLYNGKIIQNGYPRNDLVINTKRDYIVSKLKKLGVKIEDDKEIILFAPTWKGNDYFNPVSNANDYVDFKQKVEETIDTNRYQILIKPHQAEYRNMDDEYKNMGIFIPSNIDTNELLSIVDILISDYSSIYFDFMHTNKPILFYIPDLDEYENYRGVYFEIDELPGPASKKIDDIANWIVNIDTVKQQYKDAYTSTKAWACAYDDGSVSEKIIDIVFKGNLNYNIINGLVTDKKKLLVYAGGLAMNGVTFSLLSLLNHIDYNKFDISLIVFNTKNKIVNENCKLINTNVRVFARVGTLSRTFVEKVRDMYSRVNGFKSKFSEKVYPDLVYKREFLRCFGNAEFDYVVDFSGYGPFFNFILMQAKGAKRIIWQHNDLKRDLERSVKGKESAYNQRKKGMLAATTLYPLYDKIVSCGQAVMKVNKENFATPETQHKFVFSTNTINFDRIKQSLETESFVDYEDSRYYISSRNQINGENFGISGIKVPDKNKINFVTMGRLSPEKNQVNLVNAFADLYEKNKDCRLYIIGDGDLKGTLSKLINSKGLSNAVYLVGNLSNPFSYMRLCNCFVFPSKFEGQGLSVLEARILKLPIVVSDFFAVEDVIVDNGQYIVGKEQEDIYEGLKAFVDGKVPLDYEFDADKYNEEAYKQFESLFT